MKKILLFLMLGGFAYQSQAQSLESTYYKTPDPETKEEAISTGKVLSAVPVHPYDNMDIMEAVDGMATQSNDQIPHVHVYMYGTDPQHNSYEQDLAILNSRYIITPQERDPVEMRGTNPKVNSYEEDLAILNRYDKMRGKY